MKNMKIFVIVSFIVVSVFYTVESLSFGLWHGFAPGPGLLPLLLGIAMLFLCGIHLFSRDVIKSKEGDIFLNRSEAVRILVFAALTLLSVILMNTLGFLVITILFCFIVLRYLERYSMKKSVSIAVLIPSMLWFTFYIVLGLDLPKGILTIMF